MKLDFVIIGGQKCGSTYLHTVIGQHPEVNMPYEECPHFESPDYEDGGLDKLKKLLSNLDQRKKIGIKRPNYLSKPEVRDRIKQANKDVKIIVILRNPIERLKSAYYHNMNYGFIPLLPLNKGIVKLLKGELQKKYPRSSELIEFGYYAQHLKEYIKDFDERVLVLLYDDLKKNKLDTIRECYSFLEIKSDFIPDKKFLNSKPQEVNYSLFRIRLLTKKNRYQFTYNETRTRLFLKSQTKWDKFICRNIDRLDKYIVRKYLASREKPEFNSEVLNLLIDTYKSDIQELEKLLKVDLSNWTKTSSIADRT